MRDTLRNSGIARLATGLRARLADESGMALMTVLVFGFIFIIGTMAFFAVAAFEAGQTEIRENSSRAFYLADGAIERAKAELVANIKWRTGYPKTAYDGGFYRMSVDTVFFEGADRTRFYSEGFWGRTKRDVEVIANVKPLTPDLAIHASGNIVLSGNICLDGYAHANGEIIDPEHFNCGGSEEITTWDHGTVVHPPPVYTEPDSFPGATYYYLTVTDGPATGDTLIVEDRNHVRLNVWVKGVSSPETPHPDMSWAYDKPSKTLTVEFKPSTAALDQVTGPFRRQGSDFTVVLNTGGFDSGPFVDHEKTNILFQDSSTPPLGIETTIINTRFVGISDVDRRDKTKWEGGTIDTKTKARFTPRYCVGLIAQEVHGNAQVDLGFPGPPPPARPCLTYVMENVNFSAGQWSIFGSLISLGDIDLGGGVNLTYDGSFIACLPPSLSTNWPVGTGGEMEILAWREPPPR